MNWNLLQYYILSSRLYFKYLLALSLVLISCLIAYLIIAPERQSVSSTFFLEQKAPRPQIMPFQQASPDDGKLYETQKHILKSKRLFMDIKDTLLADISMMYKKRAKRLDSFLGFHYESKDLDQLKDDDKKLQKIFLRNISISYNANASSFEISYVGHSKATAKALLERVATVIENINNEKNLELQSRKAEIARRKAAGAKAKLEIANKKIEDFVIAKSFPEEESYTDGEYSEFFEIRRGLIDARKQLAVEKTRFEFTNTIFTKMESLTKNSYNAIDETKYQQLSNEMKEFKSARNLYQKNNDTQMLGYIDNQIFEIKKLIANTKSGTSKLLSRESLQTLLSSAIKEKDRAFIAYKQAKTNYSQLQQEFRRSEDKLASIPVLRNQLNKLIIERTQAQRVYEKLTELSIEADNDNIVSDFSFYKLDEAVFNEPKLSNKFKIFFVGSAFLVFLSSMMLFAISYFRGLVLHNDHLHQPFIQNIGRIPMLEIEDWQSELLRYEDISLATFEIDRHLGDQGKTIVVTSTKSESGKTVSSMLLAYSFLKQEKKVLLINSDRRSKYMNGINNLLARFFKHKEHKEVVRFSTRFGTLYMWRPRSSRSPNQDGGVSLTREVKKFINRAENKFDIIIIDAPPLEYTEARALAIVADNVIFCCPEGGISFGEFYENTRKVSELCDGKVLSLLTKSRIQASSSLAHYQHEIAAGAEYDY